jgi:hypothetical protein
VRKGDSFYLEVPIVYYCLRLLRSVADPDRHKSVLNLSPGSPKTIMATFLQCLKNDGFCVLISPKTI